jgi:5-formyltetrahydrofolate cyclo-ligase
MEKKEARRIFKQKKEEITATQRLKWDDLLLIQFQTVDWPQLTNVLSFYPIEEMKEINSFLLTDYLHFRNPSLQLFYPKTDFSTNTMQAIHCTADTPFEENKYGIFEPAQGEFIDPGALDLVIVPLLAIDKKGCRVGYGKGFYDRFLKECDEECLKVGVSYFEPVEAIDDAAEFDVPLDLCITPQQVYVF